MSDLHACILPAVRRRDAACDHLGITLPLRAVFSTRSLKWTTLNSSTFLYHVLDKRSVDMVQLPFQKSGLTMICTKIYAMYA